jgi:RNA polymerase sigma-70 factor (ECF subfamily)
MNPALFESRIANGANLLKEAQGGDAEAFGVVCRTYETRLLRQAHLLCGDASLAEDLAQETLVEAWKSLRRYNGRCQFFTWLCAILLNRYRNVLRAKRPLPFALNCDSGEGETQNIIETVSDPSPLPDETAQLHEQKALIQACTAALPAKQQQVIYLRFYVDDSLESIAAALGCSVGTVKSRLFHALERLRQMSALRNVPGTEKSKLEVI